MRCYGYYRNLLIRQQVTCKRSNLTLPVASPTLYRHLVDAREIVRMGRQAIVSNELFIGERSMLKENRIGKQGDGFKQSLHDMNSERRLAAGAAFGWGPAALRRAAKYSKKQIVFDRSIGIIQGVQHLLAKCWTRFKAAKFLIRNVVWRYDRSLKHGALRSMLPNTLLARQDDEHYENAVPTHWVLSKPTNTM